MNKLIEIWLLIPLVLSLCCTLCLYFCCCCCCFTCCFDSDEDCFDITSNCLGSCFKFFLKEPQISSKTVQPFQTRPPWTVSKRYKSPNTLVNIIEKAPSEVSNLGNSYSPMGIDTRGGLGAEAPPPPQIFRLYIMFNIHTWWILTKSCL